MTHTSTEQERAEFEKYMLLENYFSERDLVWDGVDGYDCTDADDAFGIWLIARRAQVVQVPKWLLEAAQRAHDWMERQQRQQSKGGHATFDMMMLREERDALAEALAAAPKPPEAAPVQLPEQAISGVMDLVRKAVDASDQYAVTRCNGNYAWRERHEKAVSCAVAAIEQKVRQLLSTLRK